MQLDVNLMHIFQKLLFKSLISYLCTFRKERWLGSAYINLQKGTKAGGGFFFLFVSIFLMHCLIDAHISRDLRLLSEMKIPFYG